MKRGTVPSQDWMTNGQALDIASALVQAVPRRISRTRADQLIKNKGDWQNKVRVVLGDNSPDQVGISRELEFWERHYAERYERRLNLDKVRVPILPTDKFRRPELLVIDPGLPLNQIYKVGERTFPSWCCVENLDGAVAKEQGRPKEVYAVWTEGAVEPSDEYANLSPDQLDERGLFYQIIRERMTQGVRHYERTGGGQLDLVNMTITSSRRSVGGAFVAYWGDRQFEVDWWGRGRADPCGRPREVVLPL